ncbi:recombinase family protein (plasmid) [Mesorhizobium mediterraneum]|uniref:Recombinase family protein n=3 Tax=Mesorhizobium TaxID=68287 RepID=A0AB36R1F2_9HYPH|nr:MULTISPECIES: recombinase family protein [Mesorhizobium]PAP98568.1 recombinase family protein [Mesorhizobium mediterraneum]RUU84365.1 recombinase family protein [Mesorhizobium sp. M7A.F.Ca.MR.176.00.0.0]RWA95977.1 MAG: recombinase family protein [Mesorhizobium sp.]RWB06589.1 MAG: recombinase family protein [Mesorhizobium sp.]RWN24635.1 MAG: recombinase family protein [Mesorhizobium sp.]
MMSDLITTQHLCRKAVIYIRQSTPHQMVNNQESLRLQYALHQRAGDLGWDENNIEVIDADLGQSGAAAAHRAGFKDLLGRVTLGEVGIVLSYEVTRLARNCSDWYPLLDLCGYRQCLIGDRDGIYDPGSANGRLLLGLKGTISEVELHTLRGRLTAGLLSKAKRGELALLLPAGLERDANGVVMKDSNQEVQDRIALIFSAFWELGTVGKVIRSLRDRALTIPRRNRFGDVIWRVPTASMLAGMLKNPAYAGAFVYGRTQSCHTRYASGKIISRRRPMAEWKIVVKDRYPAYLDWERYERIQTMLTDNHAEYRRNQTRGAPRDGAAVLQGIVWCGRCGHKMGVEYKNGNRYVCNFLARSQGGALCQHLPADPIDARVVEAFFAAASPAELAELMHAKDARQQADEAFERAEEQQIKRLRYQALLAERQYDRVDPDNRLIAAELERRWERALRELRQAEDALERHRAMQSQSDDLTPTEQNDFIAASSQLPEFWQRPDIEWGRKKALIRSLIDKVILQRVVRDRITIRIVWRGGEVTEREVEPRVHALSALSRGAEMEVRLLELAHQGLDDTAIAARLTKEGFRSPRRSYVPVRTVQVVRQGHRVLRQSTPARSHHIPGWLSVSELAMAADVSRSWIRHRIRNGVISIHQSATHKRVLFPDAAATIAAIKELKSGVRQHLDFTQSATE